VCARTYQVQQIADVDNNSQPLYTANIPPLCRHCLSVCLSVGFCSNLI